MIVNPELISASRAPSAKPLKSCETKLDQLSIGRRIERPAIPAGNRRRHPCYPVARNPAGRQVPPAGPSGRREGSGVRAEITAERVRLLHQRLARYDLHHLPE